MGVANQAAAAYGRSMPAKALSVGSHIPWQHTADKLPGSAMADQAVEEVEWCLRVGSPSSLTGSELKPPGPARQVERQLVLNGQGLNRQK